MTSQHGSSDFRSRISKGARESGRPHSLKRAAGGPIDSFKTGGQIKHFYNGGFNGFMKDFGDGFVKGFGGTMKVLGPLLPMLLKKGGSVSRRAMGGPMGEFQKWGLKTAQDPLYKKMRLGAGLLMNKGGRISKKAAGGVGKIRHGQMKGPK
jgi:hypothetical protein